jgi:hypothetical protein
VPKSVVTSQIFTRSLICYKGAHNLATTTGERSASISLDYVYVPLEEFRGLPGIEAATIVATNKVELIVNSDTTSGIMYAIDPATFTSVVARCMACRFCFAFTSLNSLTARQSRSINQDDSHAFARENNLRAASDL